MRYLRSILNSFLLMNFLNLISCANNINGTGDVEPPVPPPEDPTIFETFGSNLKLFYDTEDASKVSLTGYYGNEIISAVSSDSSAVSIVSLSGQRTIWNKQSIYTRGTTYMYVPSSTSIYNFLHTAVPSTIAFRMFVHPTTTGTFALLNNNNGQTTRRGINLRWVNGTLQLTITKGTSGQTVNTAYSVSNACAPGAWHNVRIRDTGSQITIIVDGVAGTPVTDLFTRATLDATNNMTIFRYAESGGTWANDVCIKNIVFLNRLTTEDEDELLDEVYLPGLRDFGGSGRANYYKMDGQSNMAGKGEYAGTPAYFANATGAMIWDRTTGPSYPNAQKFVPHQLGVSVSTENQNKTGPDLEFAYRMNLASPGTIYIAKFGVSATPLKQQPDINDWSPYSSTNKCCYQSYKMQMVESLKMLRYQLDKDVHIMGWLWRQGEGDTTDPSAYVNGDLRVLLTDHFKATAELHGFSVAECRLWFSSLDMYNATRPNCHFVVDECEDICTDAVSMGFAGGQQSSTIGYTTEDGTHFTTAGQVLTGGDAYEYLSTFLP